MCCFQIVFHRHCAPAKGAFNIDDVCQNIAEKCERRHPHVFGDRKVKDAAEVGTKLGRDQSRGTL